MKKIFFAIAFITSCATLLTCDALASTTASYGIVAILFWIVWLKYDIIKNILERPQ